MTHTEPNYDRRAHHLSKYSFIRILLLVLGCAFIFIGVIEIWNGRPLAIHNEIDQLLVALLPGQGNEFKIDWKWGWFYLIAGSALVFGTVVFYPYKKLRNFT